MSNTRSIVMLGSGPGIGVSVASHFAAQGFQKIALVSRNESRLEGEDKAAVLKAAPNAEVKTYAFDLSKYAELPELLSKIEKDSGVPEVIVFNAAHLTKSPVGEYTADEVAFDLQISVLSLYTTANWALPKLASLASSNSGSKPSLFVTSGGLYQNPFHPYFSLAASKAAQHNLTQSLAQVYAPQGVHVAAVVVNGFVGPESELFSPKKIAEVYWKLYEQGAEKGERSVWITADEEDEATKKWKAQQLL